MANVINIEKIFKETWGYIGSPIPDMVINQISGGQNTTNKLGNNDSSIAIMGRDFKFGTRKESIKSQKGVLYHGYNVSTDSITYMPVKLSVSDDLTPYVVLQNAVMSFMNSKNIVSTALVNAQGEVNEIISEGAWEIDVKGVFVGDDGNYPEDAVESLRKMYGLNLALNIENVRSAICLTGTNEKVIIKDLKFPELRGFENTQPYQMRLKSDVQFKLYID